MDQGQEVVGAPAQEPQEAPAVPPADEEQQQASTNKRLKYSKPDLQITCKGIDGSEKTFERYGAVMAWNSKYFDALLASEMQESITKKVTLEDVSPETFEIAMELLDDMSRASEATVTDFVKVASFYNRFDFQNGLNRCIGALVEFMKLWRGKGENPKKGDMENIIATICIAAETESEGLVQISSEFLSRNFISHSPLFDVDRIRRIHGFIMNNREECLNSFFRQHFSRNYERPDVSDSEFPSRLAGKLQSLEFFDCLKIESFRIGLRVEVRGTQKLVEDNNFTLRNFRIRYDPCFETYNESLRVYEGSGFANIRLFQIDETYDEEMECERFDWCVSFEWRGTSILLALPQSRNTPNPTGRIIGWEQVKGSMSGYQFKVTSLEPRLDE